jgi:hypothetical protein
MSTNNNNHYIKLKKKIENLDPIHHLKILDILNNNNISYTENRYGVHILMNNFDDVLIKKLEKFLIYIKNQEENLQNIEKLKKEFKKDFFDNNDVLSNQINNSNNDNKNDIKENTIVYTE